MSSRFITFLVLIKLSGSDQISTQDMLKKSPCPRIVNTSSVSQCSRPPSSYEMTRSTFNSYSAYEESKLFNRMLTVGQV